MKWYPKIHSAQTSDTSREPWGEPCIAFDKLDGSNLRFEWNPKQGWYKFGTRNLTFDRSNLEYGPAIDLFIAKYGDALAKVMRDKFSKVESAIAYAEFFGPISFGGKHDPVYLQQIGRIPEVVSNDPKDIVLFDFNPYKKGFMSPVEFLKTFSHLHIPKVIYEGKFTRQFTTDVWDGKFPVSMEGVVAKGGTGHKLWMRKVKTEKYLNEIRRVFKTGWEQYWD